MDSQQPTTTGIEIKQEGKEEKKEEVPKLSPKACTTFNEDVVKLTGEDGKESFAVVTRCWADEQNPDALLEAKRLGIDFTPLKPGYLEVLSPDGTRREILETSTTLVDRGFIRGDLVRPARSRNTPPSSTKTQSGTIISISSRVQLQRVLAPSEKNENWYETSDLVAAARVNRGDHVVSGDWVGIVEEVFEMALIETSNGGLRRVCDVGSNLSVGPVSEAVQAMLMERTGGFLASFMQQDLRTILDVKQILIAVNWLCKNQLESNEGDWTRPKRYWTDLNQLKLVRATADHLRTIHDKLVPRDPSLIPSSESTAPGHQIHSVTNSLSTLTVLWQDGTTTSGPSTSFEALQTLDDETEVFPGDVGIFSPSGSTAQGKIGVVQSMDTRKRTIKLRYLEEEGEETVSGLEFDPHGAPEEQFGVRRGDWVLIANEREGNGAKLPVVPSLGESETSAGIMPGGEELRMELSTIGLSYAQTLSDTFTAPLAQSSPASLASIDWYGEVWDLLLDGTALIRFPDGTKRPLPISRLIHLDDGLDPEAQALAAAGLLGPDGEGMEGSEGWMTDDGEGEDEEYELADGGESGEEEEEKDERIEDRPIAKKRKRSRRESRGWADEEDVVTMEGVEGGGDEPAETEDVAEVPSTTETPTEQEERKGVSMPSAELDDFADWSRFEVLEDVPKDHHYSNETVQVPSKTFMTRVRKEHGVLASSLPPNILVRAYESRLDLLRVLIIGPLGTPFQNAPFLFDLFLPPAKFPQEPPKVFFHSWAGGTRVSPNLYSEGKVCLSLLGTWSGDKTESWSAARSSILQILISIQGLIMVEDPYFTEPGFEKQMGTPGGTSASELYNERTLVLTRTFVKRACEYPPSGFEREINAYYYSGLPSTPPTPGALKGIVEQCKSLLEESEKWLAEKEGEEEGEVKPPQSSVVPSQRVLTEGAGLSLKRTLKGLEELMERGPKILETKDQ